MSIEAAAEPAAADAVRRARAALPAWRGLGVRQRCRHIERFRALVYRDRAEIAALVNGECGKPIPEALLADVTMALEGARFVARRAPTLFAPTSERSRVLALWRKRIVTHHEPFGVVAVISPWNYPFLFPTWHVIAALSAGNTVVFKPSEHTTECGAKLIALLHEAGVPSDVVQLVRGDGRVGAALVSQAVDKVFFTGSERTGRKIAEQCAPRFVPVGLELGGSDAAIVLRDAPLSATVSGMLWGRFSNAGQTCVACKRAIVDDTLYEPFLALMAARFHALRAAADTSLGEVDVGGVVTAAQRELSDAQLDDALAKGARLVAELEPAVRGPRFARAAVLADVTPDMRVWSEETFGPLLAVRRASSEAEAVTMANDSRYGLNASVWTMSLASARRVARQLDVGVVTFNDAVLGAGTPEVPHGGNRMSGVGRIHGDIGLLECSRPRVDIEERFPAMRQLWWFGYDQQTTDGFQGYLRLTHGVGLGERLSGLRAVVSLMFGKRRKL